MTQSPLTDLVCDGCLDRAGFFQLRAVGLSMAEMVGQFLAAASARDQWPPSAIEDCVEFGESYRLVRTNSVRAASMLRDRAYDRIW